MNPNQTIDEFLDALWAERGLSQNTLSAYRRDLQSFSVWLEKLKIDLLQVSSADIQGFIAYRGKKGVKASSLARLVSSLRRFYRYQLREGRIEVDPSALIDSPKLAKSLPYTLSESHIDALLEAAADTFVNPVYSESYNNLKGLLLLL